MSFGVHYRCEIKISNSLKKSQLGPLTAGANQPVHWFLGSKGLGIQQERVYGWVCPNRPLTLPLNFLGPSNLHMGSAHQGKVVMPNLVSHLNQRLYLSGMHFGVAPKTVLKKTCV